MLYHYTFGLYKRSDLLVDPGIRSFLKEVFSKIAAEKDFKIIECEILSDHVHLLVDQSYNLSTSFVMKNIKGVSSRRLFEKYDTNRFEIRKLWARGFFAGKIGSFEKDAVVKYIRTQRTPDGSDKRY